MLNDIGNFIDKHIWLIRNLTTLSGCIGIVLIVKRYHLVSRYHTPVQIPDDLILKQILLRGQITGISKEGLINVRHQPILFRGWNKNVPALPFILAGVEPKSGWHDHMNTHFNKKLIQFTVLQKDDETVKGILYFKQGLFNRRICINEDVVKNGVAITQSNVDASIHTTTNVTAYDDLIKRLVKTEMHADVKGLGIWKEFKQESILAKIVNYLWKK